MERHFSDAPGDCGEGVPDKGDFLTCQELGKKLQWLECLTKGICKSKHLEAYLKRWEQRGDKEGEFMVERKDEDNNLTDD